MDEGKSIPEKSETISLMRNSTAKEKKLFMWEVNEDMIIKTPIMKGLDCFTKEYEPYSAFCEREPSKAKEVKCNVM